MSDNPETAEGQLSQPYREFETTLRHIVEGNLKPKEGQSPYPHLEAMIKSAQTMTGGNRETAINIAIAQVRDIVRTSDLNWTGIGNALKSRYE